MPPRRPEEARSADDGRSGGNGGQACLPSNFQAIAKKIKISEKSANYQPNPQYQPKNVTIYIIAEWRKTGYNADVAGSMKADEPTQEKMYNIQHLRNVAGRTNKLRPIGLRIHLL